MRPILKATSCCIPAKMSTFSGYNITHERSCRTREAERVRWVYEWSQTICRLFEEDRTLTCQVTETYSSVNCDCCSTSTEVTRHSWKYLDSYIATANVPEKNLASKGSDQEHKGVDTYKGVQMKIVRKHLDRRSSGSIPINQCHIPINPISLGRGEMMLHNTEVLCFPSQPERRQPKSRRDI